jgi:dienelactone hydrolase
LKDSDCLDAFADTVWRELLPDESAAAMKPIRFPCKYFGRLAACCAVALLLLRAEARAEELRFEPIQIPVSAPGGIRSLELEAIVVRPDDGAAHPLAVLNHGSPRNADDRPTQSPYRMWPEAVAFARRGWAVVVPMRRGYGSSQGEWAEGYGSCSNPDYAAAGRQGASDIAAVARYMSGQSYVSKGKWISVGHSAGAFATVALAADAPSDLAAAIAFAPGRGSTAPDEVCGEKQLIGAFAQYGKTSRVPLLWVAADNDHFFGPRLVPLLTNAFTGAGGKLSFVKTAAFGDDGHQLFTTASGVPIWSSIVDRFLAANGLALRDHLIDVTPPNVAAPAGLSSQGRETFKTYLESGPNKAFAVSDGGARFGWATGRRTPDDARKAAMDYCTSGASAKCRVVNVNNRSAQ